MDTPNDINSVMEQLSLGASNDIDSVMDMFRPLVEQLMGQTARSSTIPTSRGAGSSSVPTHQIDSSRETDINHYEQPLQFEGTSLVQMIDSSRETDTNHYEQPRQVEGTGPVQMIKEDGTFNEALVGDLIRASETLSACGDSYVVVSIIGAQSSGKSFLLNRLFGTNFEVMDAQHGRRRTTKGVVLSRCEEPYMLIMDIEGSDGIQGAQRNRNFERQTALFALTISDLMLVNVNLHDIGREEGGSVPLFTTLFQERVKLGPGRTKVVVVIRHYDDQTPFHILKQQVAESMKMLWDSIHHPSDQSTLQFSAYIEVLVATLPDAASQETRFIEEVRQLREHLVEGDPAGYRQGKVPASGFSFSAKEIWETIQQNRRLDIPTHRVMVSIIFCERFMNESRNLLHAHVDYLSLEENTPTDFSRRLDNLLDFILLSYDQETLLYEEHVRNLMRQRLENYILNKGKQICLRMLERLSSRASSESKDVITSQLETAPDPTMIIDELIEEHMQMFVESCEGFCPRYRELCEATRKRLKEKLTAFAQTMIQARRMREQAEVERDEAQRNLRNRVLPREEAEHAIIRQLHSMPEFEHMRQEAEHDAGFMDRFSAMLPFILPILISIITAILRRNNR